MTQKELEALHRTGYTSDHWICIAFCPIIFFDFVSKLFEAVGSHQCS